MSIKRTQLRLPDELHQWLSERAKKNDRSMNAEINRILKLVKESGQQEENKAA